MDRKLINYLPSFLQEYKELKIITDVEQLEIEEAWEAAEKLLEEPFVLSTSQYGISRMEKMLKIRALDTDDLETRRFRVLLKLNEILPYTYRTIRKCLDDMCGRENYDFEVDIEKFTIDAIFEIEERQKLIEIRNYLDSVLPANLLILFAKRSRLEFIQKIQYHNILEINSEFFPRFNKPLLILDGDWFLDGTYPLNGYKDSETIDFYPSILQTISFISEDTKLKNQFHLESSSSFYVKNNNYLNVTSNIAIKKETQENLLFHSNIRQNISTKENLVMEKDLWNLDGTYFLDGTKLLDAEIIEHRL